MYPVHRYKKGGDEQAYGGGGFFTFQPNLQNILWFGKMMIMSGPGFSLSSLQRHTAAGYIAPAHQVAGRSRWRADHLHSTLTLPLTTTLENGLQNFQKKLDKFWSKTLSILVNFNYNQRGGVQKSKWEREASKASRVIHNTVFNLPTLCPSHFHSSSL